MDESAPAFEMVKIRNVLSALHTVGLLFILLFKVATVIQIQVDLLRDPEGTSERVGIFLHVRIAYSECNGVEVRPK